MRAIATAVALVLVGCAAPDEHRGHSQGTASYAGEQRRAIKALSEEDVKGYLAGAGMGLAKPAELNGYPGPMHTLELAGPLQLSSTQQESIATIMRDHKAEARKLGAEIVQLEAQLDALFAQRRADERAVARVLDEIGATHAKIRGSHLAAHLATTRVLRPEQVREYARLRGYANS